MLTDLKKDIDSNTIMMGDFTNETKSWFLEKINKFDKPLFNQTQWGKHTHTHTQNREKAQINKVRNEKGEVKTDTTEI